MKETPNSQPNEEATSIAQTSPVSQPSPSLSPNPAATATKTALQCLARGGEIEELSLSSDILKKDLWYRVYTPPCYKEFPDLVYPSLYLIHGQTFTDDQWDRLGADETADKLIAAGELSPFLIIMPFDHSSAQPSVDLFAEALVLELMPQIEKSYRVQQYRLGRAVGGLSRGASWAFHLAFLNPDLFGAVGGHSPPVFVEDAPHIRDWIESIPPDLMPRIWLDIGERDQRAILDSATWFAAMLDDLDIPHDWHLFAGRHDEAYWTSHVELYLRWYAQPW